jgi:hypothetical protein
VRPKNRSLNTAEESVEEIKTEKPAPKDTNLLDLSLQGYKVVGKGFVKGMMVIGNTIKWMKDKNKTE